MAWNDPQPGNILRAIWDALREGVTDRRSPMRTPTLVTASDNDVFARTVVLRGADEVARVLTCHTDARSAKVAEISVRPRVAWHFYHPAEKIQLRMRAVASVITSGPEHERIWQQTQLMARRCYMIEPGPGEPVEEETTGLPEQLTKRVPTEEESASGAKNFAVVRTEVDEIEWLYLRASGHRRIRFRWDGHAWLPAWLIP
jgi:pyridoxamine 5'-phosphate oxidase